MPIRVRPATEFDDLKTVLGPKRADANVCWCLTYRLASKENISLRGPARGAKVASLLERGPLGYPVDNQGERVDLTMAYVGTRVLFEKAGFRLAAETTSVIDGFPRVLMRFDLRR